MAGKTKWAEALRRDNLRLASRAMMAVSLAALVAVVVRLRGTRGARPRKGGWHELPDHRPSSDGHGPS